MNNETVSTLSNEIISVTYQGTIQVYMYLGSYAVFIYASLLHFPDEVKYIWKSKFTLPAYLYLLSKYPLFFFPPLTVIGEFSSISICNDLGILTEVLSILPFLGVQGLISVRTYALCQSYHRLVAVVTSAAILAVLAAKIYGMTVPDCSALLLSKSFHIFDLIQNIMVGLLDILAFVVVVHRVWGPWKLKRSTSLRSNKDLVTSIIEQGALRFCFVLFLTNTGIFLSFLTPIINGNFTIFQNILSTLLMCEFTLDLRKRDAKKKIFSPSAINLPNISFQESPVQSIRSALGRLHESIVAEMGERNEPVPVDWDSSGSREPDDLQNSTRADDAEVA